MQQRKSRRTRARGKRASAIHLRSDYPKRCLSAQRQASHGLAWAEHGLHHAHLLQRASVAFSSNVCNGWKADVIQARTACEPAVFRIRFATIEAIAKIGTHTQ